MIALARAISAAQCAFIFSPPRSTNSTMMGIAAKIELIPSELLTGSSTCLYMPHPPVAGLSSEAPVPPAALHYAPAGAGRAVRHLLQRHALPGHGPRGRRAAGSARGGGLLPRGADLLRADAPQF